MPCCCCCSECCCADCWLSCTCVLHVAEWLVCLPHDIGLAVDVQHRLLAHVVPQHTALACGRTTVNGQRKTLQGRLLP